MSAEKEEVLNILARLDIHSHGSVEPQRHALSKYGKKLQIVRLQFLDRRSLISIYKSAIYGDKDALRLIYLSGDTFFDSLIKLLSRDRLVVDGVDLKTSGFRFLVSSEEDIVCQMVSDKNLDIGFCIKKGKIVRK